MNPTGVIVASPILICRGDEAASAWSAGSANAGEPDADGGRSRAFSATMDVSTGWELSDVLTCAFRFIAETTTITAMNKNLKILFDSKPINRDPFCGW